MLIQPHQQLLPSVLYSSRRRTRGRAGPAPGQTRIPDWVWGAGLGLIVIIAVGGYFLLSGGGGSASTCDRPLAPLGASVVNQESLNEEDVGLERVISLLTAGDRVGAEQSFYGPVHNFTHNFDPPLREVDEDAAKELCREVLNAEQLLEQRAPNGDIVRSLTLIRRYIADGAVILGYDRPGKVLNIEETDEQGVLHGRAT